MERKIVLNIKEGVIVEYEQPNHFPNSPHRVSIFWFSGFGVFWVELELKYRA